MLNKKTKLLAAILLNILLNATLFTIPGHLLAQTLVKSVDASGNITYSDKALPDAKTSTEIEISAGPSKSEINAAKQQARKSIRAAQTPQSTPGTGQNSQAQYPELNDDSSESRE